MRKVIKLISKQAELEASNEASLKQAKNVSDHCQKVMTENEKLKEVSPHHNGVFGQLRQRVVHFKYNLHYFTFK